MRSIYCYTILIFLSGGVIAQQPDLKFEHISKGLSNTAVNFIMQDQQGFMWFATNDGLNRYDGYSFKQFKNIPGDSNSIANNNVTYCHQTSDGKIWVATYDNMSVYDPMTGRFSTIRKGPDFYATGFAGYHQNQLWVGAHTGFYSYNPGNKTWNEILLSEKPGRNCIVTKGDGDWLWIGTWNGFYKYNSLTRQSKKYYLPVSSRAPRPTNIVGSCTKDSKGYLWFTSWENGLHRFDPATEKFESFYDDPQSPKSLVSNITKATIENTDGTIWVANAFGGLTVYDPQLQRTFNYSHNPANPFSFHGNSAESICKDKDGTIWIGTDKGINKYSAAFNFFKTVKLFNNEHAHEGLDYNRLAQDEDGELWSGNFFGFFHIDPLSGKVTEYSRAVAGIENPPINDILIDENNIIWAASNACLYKIEKIKTANSFHLKSSRIALAPYQASIMSLVKDDPAHLWLVSNSSGIYRFDKITHALQHFLPGKSTGENNNDVLSFARLDKDHWLAGIRNSGLILFDAVSGSFKPVKLDLEKTGSHLPLVLDIYQDKKQNIWIATLSDGLIQTDRSLKEFKQYTEQDGLPSMRVYHVDEDQQGNIWLNTFGGLSVLDPIKKTFRNYGNNEGLRNQNLLNDFYKTEKGIFIMGDEGCLQVFDPAKLVEKNVALPVYITAVKVHDREYPVNSPIILDYNRNYISFDFVALDYNEAEKIKYAYQLEGAGKDWQSTGNLRSISFSNLKEGRYTFKVRAAGTNGIWYDSRDIVRFRIRTPFWKAWWFYFFVGTFVAGAFYYLYRLKLKRIRNEEKIRDKIARDLHDDIGSTLSGINLYSKMALNKTENSAEETKLILSKIEERTGNMMDAMSDIVWSINPHNDTVADLLVRMREYAAEMLEAKDINYQFEAGEMTGTQKLDLNTRKEIFLVFKEAVNNAAKHSHCTSMVIKVATHENKFDLYITDNGKGMPELKATSGNGLANMKARAKQVNGSLVINSSLQEGTGIHLQVPLT